MTTRRFAITVFGLAALTLTAHAQDVQRPGVRLQAAIKLAVVDGNVTAAIHQFEALAEEDDPAVAAEALVQLGRAYERRGVPGAREAFERVVREHPDQARSVAVARAWLAANPAAMPAQTGVVRRVIYEDAEWNVHAVSPDGRFAVGRAAGTQPLILRELPARNGRVAVQETETSRAVAPWVFSPDGTRMAFTWIERQGNAQSTSVGVIGTSPSAPLSRITPALPGPINRIRIAPIAWSADGSSLVVRTAEFSTEGRMTASTLDWVSVESGKASNSIPFPVQNESPTMSPNGDYFAYEKAVSAPGPATESRIYTVDSSGQNETEVVRIAGRHRSPVWTPDGSAILFLSNRNSRDGLWAVRVEDGQALGDPVLVQDSLAGGVQLTGVTADHTVYLREIQPERQHVFIGERRAGARSLRAYDGGGVSWSPDGAAVAFGKSEGRGQGASLIIKDVATGAERQFSHPGGLGPSQVRWSRDGQSILVVVRGAGLHILDVRSGQFRQVPNAAGRVRASVADFSPDGQTIYTASRAAGGAATEPFTELVAVDVATGEEHTVADLQALGHRGDFGISPAIAVSPDGRHLAVQVLFGREPPSPVLTARLSLVAVDGSGSSVLTQPYESGPPSSTIAWTPDGQSVLFLTGGVAPPRWRLMRVSVDGGEPVFDGLERATLQDDSSLPVMTVDPPFSLTVSPDGSRIAFSADAGRVSQLVALDNVLAALAAAR